MRTRITTIACLGTLAAGVVAAAPAQAKTPVFGFKQAKFRAEVSGVQTTAWKAHHEIQNTCDSGYKGDGTEVIRFTGKPFRTEVTSYDKTNPSFRTGRTFGAPLHWNAKVTRRSNLTKWDSGTPCSYGDGKGGTQPPAPDCGQRTLGVYAELRFYEGRLLVDDQDDGLVPLPGYRNCDVWGTAYPQMLWRGGNNAVGKPLTAKQLWSGPKERVIKVGRREVHQDADSWYETTITYTIKLTRISKVRVF
jgi:hypothetical protein